VAKTGTTEIRLNKRTLRIGGQVYPLANISRVQAVRIGTVKSRPIWRFVKGTLGISVVAVAAAAVTTRAVPDRPSLPAVILAAAGSWIGLLLLILLYRLAKRPVYALAIETAGTQYTVLSSYRRDDIQMLETEVVAAIEDPPDRERVLHIDNVIQNNLSGNSRLYQQNGANSRMGSMP
jgi:hypothetical protein